MPMGKISSKKFPIENLFPLVNYRARLAVRIRLEGYDFTTFAQVSGYTPRVSTISFACRWIMG